MKHGNKLTMNAGDFQYLTGETHYNFPIEDGTLRYYVSADGEYTAYLVDRNGQLLPLVPYAQEYRLFGFTEFLIVTKSKKTSLAVKVDLVTAKSADPLDYQPVDVGPPPAFAEKALMRQAIQQELAARGIDLDDDEFDPVEEGDLEFYDDDFEGYTQSEAEELRSMQPQEESDSETNPEDSEENSPQPEDEPAPPETDEK